MAKSSVSRIAPVNNGEADFDYGANETAGPSSETVPATPTASPTPTPTPTESKPVETMKAPNPFSADDFRSTQSFSAIAGVKQVQRTIPHRKPDKSWWLRAHPDAAYRLETGVIEREVGDTKEIYPVKRYLWPELSTEPTFKPKMFITAINRQNNLFLWEINLPQENGDKRSKAWAESALNAVKMAMKNWVRVVANMGTGGYDVWEATGRLPEPIWPTLSFDELLRISFKGQIIDSLDHPILRELRGEVGP